MMEAATSKLSRRTMIAGLTVGAAGLGAAAYAAMGAARNPIMASDSDSWWTGPGDNLQLGAMRVWRARVGQQFQIEGGASYTLSRVEPLESKGERPPEVARRSAFLAVFEAAEGAAVEGNRTYTVTHSTGALEIFFGAADPQSPNRLLAVFN